MNTIVWDVDDVLNNLMGDWLDRAWRPAHPQCDVAYREIRENPPHRVLGIPLDEYRQSLDAFRAAEGAVLEPAAEVLRWFHAHGHRARHSVLTAVPLRGAPMSAAWVLRHFGRWINSVGVVPSPRSDEQVPAYDQSKRDYLAWWGRGDIFVDDNATTVDAVRDLGIEAILWPRPWNQGVGSIADRLVQVTGLLTRRPEHNRRNQP